MYTYGVCDSLGEKAEQIVKLLTNDGVIQNPKVTLLHELSCMNTHHQSINVT